MALIQIRSDQVTSGSLYPITSSWALNAITASFANTASYLVPGNNYNVNFITASGVLINGNLTVSGSIYASTYSASNIYVTTSQFIVTDNIITLNALTPYKRYAGIEMYDSGSNTLSSFLWDGQSDYFFLSGSSVNGKILTGPDGQTDLTTNYVPKATAGYKLGNSTIYDSGTYVGIGTTNTTYGLSVSNNTTGQGGAMYIKATVNSGGRGLVIDSTGRTTADNDVLILQTVDRAGSPSFNVTVAGSVGINTNAPINKLDVVGTSVVPPMSSTSTRGDYPTYKAILPSSADAEILFSYSNTSYGWKLVQDELNTGDLMLRDRVNNVDINRVYYQRGTGYVGIGRRSPSFLLDVSGSSRHGTISSDTHQFTGSVSILGSLSTNANITCSNISASGTGSFGIIGIGTSLPSAKLTIVDNTNGGTIHLVGRTSDDTAVINFRANGDASTYAYIAPDTNEFRMYHNDGFMSFYPGGSEKVRITSTGNVGIGTTTPTARLNIASTSQTTKAIIQSVSAATGLGGYLAFNPGGDSTYSKVAMGIYDNYYSSYNRGNIAFMINAAADSTEVGFTDTKMYISGSGAVGIGTTTPIGGLHINYAPGAFSEVLRLQRNGSIFYSVGLDTNYLNIAYNGNVNANNIFVLKNDGYLGLGNLQTALFNLDIASTQAKGIQLRYDTTTNYLAQITPYWNSSTDTRIDFAINRLSGSTPSVIMSVGYNTNVGIGTTSPNSKLEVQGNGQFGNDSVTNVGLKITRLNGGVRTSEHTYHSSQNSPWYTYGQNLTWTNELAGTVESTQVYRPYFEAFAPVVGYKIFGFMNVNTGSFTSANIINALVIKNDGNVGIGTTSPAYKLDVSGSSRFGYQLSDNHYFTGSINISGSLNLTGSQNMNGPLYMNNYNIEGINTLIINDPGSGEGILWSQGYGWGIYECPNDFSNTGGNLQFVSGSGTVNVRRLTLNTDGNAVFPTGSVGVGTDSLSSWGSGRTTVELFGTSTATYFSSATYNNHLSTNYYYNSGHKFINASNRALYYLQRYDGQHQWFTSTADSSGAGSSATMSQLMTLTNTGTLGIGTTAPSTYSSQVAIETSLTRGMMVFNTALADAGTLYGLGFGYAMSNYNSAYISFYKVGNSNTLNRLGFSLWNQNDILNILGNGNVGIGSTNPYYKFEVYSGGKLSTFTGLSINNFNNYDGTSASLVKSQLRFAILESPTDTYNSPSRTFTILESGNEVNNSSSDGFFAISTRTNGSVTEKLRVTSLGYVGIGTTAPTTKLHVTGSHVSGNGMSRFESSDYAIISLKAPSNGDGSDGYWGFRAQDTANNDLMFYGYRYKPTFSGFWVDPSFAGIISKGFFVRNSDGSVGVGTNIPNAKLNVNSSGSLASGSVVFRVEGTQGSLFSVDDSLSGSLMSVNDISGLPILEVFSDDRVVMGTFNSNTLVVTGSRVGIGVPNPTYKLDVSGSALFRGLYNNGLIWDAGDDNNYFSSFKPTGVEVGRIGFDGYSSTSVNYTEFRIDTRANGDASLFNRMYINSLGNTFFSNTNVGIGTSSPAFLLDVSGSSRHGYRSADTHQFTGSVSINGSLFTNANISSSGTGFFSYVGIGTTTVPTKLTIVGNDNKDTGPIISLSGESINQFESGRIRFTESNLSGSPYYQGAYVHYDGSTNTFNLGVHGNVDSLTASDTNAISILRSNAYVGIGTTNPQFLLDVVNTSISSVLRIGNAGGNNGAQLILAGSNTTKNWVIANQQNLSGTLEFTQTTATGSSTISGTPAMVINSSNYVGIGTTNPKMRLDVVGAGGKIAITNTLTTDYAELHYYEGSSLKANIWVNGSNQTNYAGANSFNIWQGSNAPMAFYTNGNNERMRIDNAGNVGIGTVNPGQKLHVVGNVYGTTYGQFGTAIASGTNASNAVFGSNSATVGVKVVLDSDVNRNDICVTTSSGFVGIGTSIAPARLTVNGDISGSVLNVSAISSSGNLIVNGTVTCTTLIETSTINVKSNIIPLKSQLDKVTKLNPVSFTYKYNNEPSIGLIAEEVAEIYPEFTSKNHDAVAYSKIVSVLIQSVKELKETIDKQQEQINSLLNK